ncbi:MAG TPA: plastocyanin/azurin family copper-binding protein [Ktedonobacteraceae bacterium]|nr:plastocyanin/azurin family copper-binding protein [Ktedonobacteraceae bacterium]
MKKLIAAFVVLSMITVLVVACGGSGSGSSGSGSSGGGGTVHMGQTNFVQSSVTISKGSSVTLVSDDATVHIIANGSWVNGVAEPKQESGAPTVNNIQFSTAGQSQDVGPFNNAGTFHLYCSVHPGMNLTVTVQ